MYVCMCAGARATAGVLLYSKYSVCVCAGARATAAVLLVSTLCVLAPGLRLEYC